MYISTGACTSPSFCPSLSVSLAQPHKNRTLIRSVSLLSFLFLCFFFVVGLPMLLTKGTWRPSSPWPLFAVSHRTFFFARSLALRVLKSQRCSIWPTDSEKLPCTHKDRNCSWNWSWGWSCCFRWAAPPYTLYFWYRTQRPPPLSLQLQTEQRWRNLTAWIQPVIDFSSACDWFIHFSKTVVFWARSSLIATNKKIFVIWRTTDESVGLVLGANEGKERSYVHTIKKRNTMNILM